MIGVKVVVDDIIYFVGDVFCILLEVVGNIC